MELILPSIELEPAFSRMVEEYRVQNEGEQYTSITDHAAYIQHLLDEAKGVNLKPGYVPASTYWLMVDGDIAGVGRLRHRLTPELEFRGGHIGYDISPPFRRRGLGTELLRLTLEKAAELSLERVLISCDDENIGSYKIIEKNGGMLEDKRIDPVSGKLFRRYWIEL
jgi:predicted acetyltransferase